MSTVETCDYLEFFMAVILFYTKAMRPLRVPSCVTTTAPGRIVSLVQS